MRGKSNNFFVGVVIMKSVTTSIDLIFITVEMERESERKIVEGKLAVRFTANVLMCYQLKMISLFVQYNDGAYKKGCCCWTQVKKKNENSTKKISNSMLKTDFKRIWLHYGVRVCVWKVCVTRFSFSFLLISLTFKHRV